ESFAIVSVQGPKAADLLAQVSGDSLELEPYAHAEVTVAGVPVRVINRSDAVTSGFHCWTAPEHVAALWKAWRRAGALAVGGDAGEIRRVEAGIARYDRDVDETVIPPETRLETLVSYSKGCYIGQETVARVKYRGHINRGLAGLVLEGDDVPSAGAAVVAGDKDIGRVTSAVRSLSLGKPIALGYIRREHFQPRSVVSLQPRTPLRFPLPS